MCKCVSYLRRRYLRYLQFWKIHLYGIENIQSNGASPVFLLLDLDLHFQGQRFGILLDMRISSKRWEIEQALLLPPDGKSDVCHRMVPPRMLYIMTLTYISKVMNFEMWISRKRWELKKCSSTTFIEDSWYLQSNGTIANVLHLTFIFKVRRFPVMHWLQEKCAGIKCPL